jgi:hypothetical protein
MALITNMTLVSLDRDVPHTEVQATYSVVTASDGTKYLQIDTYGSRQRRMQGKKSQSIRFGPSTLRQLRRVIDELS